MREIIRELVLIIASIPIEDLTPQEAAACQRALLVADIPDVTMTYDEETSTARWSHHVPAGYTVGELEEWSPPA